MHRTPPPPEAWVMAQGDFGRQLAEAVLSYPAFVLWSTGETRGRTNDEDK